MLLSYVGMESCRSIRTFFHQHVQRNRYNRPLTEEQIIEGADRYPLSAAIGFKNCRSILTASNNRPPSGIPGMILSIVH